MYFMLNLLYCMDDNQVRTEMLFLFRLYIMMARKLMIIVEKRDT